MIGLNHIKSRKWVKSYIEAIFILHINIPVCVPLRDVQSNSINVTFNLFFIIW